MTLLEEYNKQNVWRDWERYIKELPLSPEQTVFDLGCSIGAVSNLLAKRVCKVIGFDNDNNLLGEANKHCEKNCEFVSENIFLLDPKKFGKCDGIWMSFTLAYMSDPSSFISNWTSCLKSGGWFALIDIDGLFSIHLTPECKYYQQIELFEKLSEESKIYDFRIGRKMKCLMEQLGLKIIFEDEDWYDKELNFTGSAAPDVLQNWASRLERMVSLKSFFGDHYKDFCETFLKVISLESHSAKNGVRFLVGIKRSL